MRLTKSSKASLLNPSRCSMSITTCRNAGLLGPYRCTAKLTKYPTAGLLDIALHSAWSLQNIPLTALWIATNAPWRWRNSHGRLIGCLSMYHIGKPQSWRYISMQASWNPLNNDEIDDKMHCRLVESISMHHEVYEISYGRHIWSLPIQHEFDDMTKCRLVGLHRRTLRFTNYPKTDLLDA